MTYDNVATLRDFATRANITYPLLADPESSTIRGFRMLDPDNSANNIPDHGAKNVAYPGWFWIEPTGTVRDRFIDGNWNDRFSANTVITRLFPELIEKSGPQRSAPHLEADLLQSDRSASPGSRITLAVEIRLPKGVHVYAPGAVGYKPLELILDPGIEFATRPPSYPKSKILYLKAIKERVPVFEGKLRVSQDIVISDRGAFQRKLPKEHTQSLSVVVKGTLRYQACDRRECFRPASLPIEWTLYVHRNDNVRPAAENQKPVK